MILDIIQMVLSAVLGGLLVKLVTLNQARQKAVAEVQDLRLDNTEHATKILMDNVVVPLQKELKSTRRCISRLNRAIEAANRCEYSDDCPVRHELQNSQGGDSATPHDNDRE